MPETPSKFPSLAIGIDLGATKTASVLISPEGEIVARHNSPTNASEDPLTALTTVADHIRSYQDDFSGRILGIGVGAPGWHDHETGTIMNAVNVGWENFSFTNELREQFAVSLPVFHHTDAIAETLGEYYYGAAQGYTDFVYLGVGSGLGSGAFSSNMLLVGSTGMAGGIGHYGFGSSQEICICGLEGCIEQRVGGIALTSMLNQKWDDFSESTSLKKNQLTDHHTVVSVAQDGDPLAVAAISEMGRWLGVAMSMYITLINPRLIVIGGGLGLAAFSMLVPKAIEEAQRRTLTRYWEKLEIKRSTVLSTAVGAACLVWKHMDKGGEGNSILKNSPIQI